MSSESPQGQGIGHTFLEYVREVGRNFPDFVREYALFIGMHIKSFRSQALPSEYLYGDKGDVILLPGYGERWPFMGKIARYFHNQGFSIHILEGLEKTRNLGRVEDYVKELEGLLRKIDFENCIIVTHSKGGLIAMQYLIQLLEQTLNVQSPLFINIAVPYGGTLLGYLDRLLFNLTHGYELLPRSAVIIKIQKGMKQIPERIKEKIISISAELGDNHIIPSGNALLPPQLGIENFAVRIYGHTRILFSDSLLKLLGEILIQRVSIPQN